MFFNRTLKNGVRIVGDRIEEMRSICIGIWVRAGSVIETPAQNGMSHFIEHMLFKGTEKRSYKQIAEEMDNVGGVLNAFTSKEFTCYYAKVIDERQSLAVDVLTDMFCNSRFAEKEIEKEKGVVLEEIAMSADSPDSVAHDEVASLFFAGDALAQKILGPADAVRSFTREGLLAYRDARYIGENVAVVAVGNVDVDCLCADVEAKLGGLPGGSLSVYPAKPLERKSRFLSFPKDVEQVHIALGFPAYTMLDMRRYAMNVVASVLGGRMSSLLFQRIREEMGAAYSIYAYPDVHISHGMVTVYAGTSAQSAAEVTEEILRVMRKMKQDGISAETLANTKEMLRGSYILGQESTSARMSAMGKQLLTDGRVLSEEDVLARIDAITMEQIEEALALLVDEFRMAGVFVGAVETAPGLDAYLGEA